MKKKLALVLSLLLLFTTILAGCGGAQEPAEDTGDSGEALKVVCLLNGNLGDKSFFDSANQGMAMIKDQLGAETKVVEMGFDNTAWESTLYEFADSDYDVIIVGTYQMQELLAKVAPEYPDKRFIIFDSEVAADNVYSITFKQNEASYLAGALAAMMAADSDLTNGQKKIGAVLAMDIPVLNDFLVGYIQGASDVVPGTTVAVSQIGDFADTARAKELATAQYNSGVGVCMHVAAQAGLGVIDAAKTMKTWAIGVDADQAMALASDDPDASAQIVTSVLKNIDQVLLRAITKHIDGTLPYGSTESLGITDKAVGLADNEVYRGIATEDMVAKVAELQAKIESGEIQVKSAFDMSTEEIAAYKASVEPK